MVISIISIDISLVLTGLVEQAHYKNSKAYKK